MEASDTVTLALSQLMPAHNETNDIHNSASLMFQSSTYMAIHM